MAKPIGTLGVIDTLTVGGRVFTDVTSNLIIIGSSGPNGTGNHNTMRKPGSASGYQVTSGKTLTLYAFSAIASVLGSGGGIQFAYGSTDVGFNSNSAPAGVFYFGSGSANATEFSLSPVGTTVQGAIHHPIPALNYADCLSATATNTLTCYAYGYEA